ncbi:hypothetical protein CNMCM5793_007665 [Aspergillus hiratsukae]|uniref:Rhamnogalacturonase A/B/Epimerase-like pectate lyase domain-containing protein n=1 Tax=Aspergillus hiratsukae TaxID=1194566 RepID=A0A8H6PHW4_9EURO|nr:hypothetical protein CNMCM5793_007665 [Aspergillus hiratsukae]
MARFAGLLTLSLSFSILSTALPAGTHLQTPTDFSTFNVEQWVPSLDYVPHKQQATSLTSSMAKSNKDIEPFLFQFKTKLPVPGTRLLMFLRETSRAMVATKEEAVEVRLRIVPASSAGASNGPNRASHSMGTTGNLQSFIVGDALNPPTLKASANLPSDHIIYGKDPSLGGTINFYIGFKNVIIDSTSVAASKSITLLDWTVSQATQLTNVVFNMPTYSNHVGVTSQYDSNSNIILNNLTFNGGAIGMELSGQQWILKGITTNGANVGIKAGAFQIVCLDCNLSNGATGIDASGISGSLTVIDSSGTSLGNMIVSSNAGGSAPNSIILENVQCTNSGSTVSLNNNAVLSGSVTNTWVHGNMYSGGATTPAYEQGSQVTTPRANVLLGANSKYFTMAPPTYSQYSSDQFVNTKTVSGLPVMGDGATDDTANINAILAQYAGCKIIYFPAGTYIVTGTIFVPAGSIIVGDAYASAISATGSNFWNPDAPTAVVKVGNAGDVGVAQFTDMLFTVADVLQGCKLPLATWDSGTRISVSVVQQARKYKPTAMALPTSAKPPGACSI